MNNSQLINQTSGIVEYFTPQFIIEAARGVLGEIGFDPASTPQANERIQARRFFTKKDDGLSQPWEDHTWMNHPFGRGLNERWINKFMHEVEIGHTTEALCITYACTSEAWFQPLLNFPQCYLCPRTNYLLADGTVYRGVTKGSVVTYIGREPMTFWRHFHALGNALTR